MAHDDTPDAELARRTAAGDPKAFGLLYDRHRAKALTQASRVVGSSDAEDVVSEAFIRMLRGLTIGTLSPGVPFVAYLLAVTRNVAIDRRRLLTRFADGDAGREPPCGGPEPDDWVIARQEVEQALAAFRTLRPRWQKALWLTEVEGIPARDAAVLLGLSANSTAQLARRARLGLRKRHGEIANR
jgi:RNA polymerase sigma factor (sigma-70 family)